jgi:hypothetical protein
MAVKYHCFLGRIDRYLGLLPRRTVMKAIPLILLAIILFMYFNIMISAENPCSAFSSEQSFCNSDNYPPE